MCARIRLPVHPGVNGDKTVMQTRVNKGNKWSAVTEVSSISNTSPPVTVISPRLYKVHKTVKTFGSTSLQTHMRSENQIFDDRLRKSNSDRSLPLGGLG